MRADGTLAGPIPRRHPYWIPAIILLIGLAKDIIQRKEDALLIEKINSDQQRRLYETVTSTTPDLLYVFDLDYRMWGKLWEEAIGRRLLDNGYEPWYAEMHEKESMLLILLSDIMINVFDGYMR